MRNYQLTRTTNKGLFGTRHMTEMFSVYIFGLWPPSPHFLYVPKKNKVLAFPFFTTPDILLSSQAKKELELYCPGRVRKKPSSYLFWTRNCFFFWLVFSRFLTCGYTQLFGLSQRLFKTSLCLMYGERVIKKDRSGTANYRQNFKGSWWEGDGKEENKTPHSNKSKKHWKP